MARAYAGTVMLEGTTLSEGRGTTRPLELLGAPGLEPRSLLTAMERIMPAWLHGLPPAAVLVRAHVPETLGQVVRRVSDPRRRRRLSTRRIPSLAPDRRRFQVHPAPARRIPVVARLSRTSTSTRASPSISSTAANCCASGSTTRRRLRPISTGSPRGTKPPGKNSAATSCCIADPLDQPRSRRVLAVCTDVSIGPVDAAHRVGERRHRNIPGGDALVERQPATVVDAAHLAGGGLELAIHLGGAFGGAECRVR